MLAAAEGCSPFIVLQAALAAFIATETAQRDVIIGFPNAARDDGADEVRIGCHVRSLIVRVAVDEETTFRELVARTRRAVLGALRYQHVPSDDLASIGITWEAVDIPVELGLQRVTPCAQREELDTDLWFYVDPAERDALAVHLVYDAALFKRTTAAALLEGYLALVRAAVAAPETVPHRGRTNERATGRTPHYRF